MWRGRPSDGSGAAWWPSPSAADQRFVAPCRRGGGAQFQRPVTGRRGGVRSGSDHDLPAAGQRRARAGRDAVLPAAGRDAVLPAAAAGRDAAELAATAGDDYELLFTVPPERRAAVEAAVAGVTWLGAVRDGAGVAVLVGPDGRPRALAGYEHG